MRVLHACIIWLFGPDSYFLKWVCRHRGRWLGAVGWVVGVDDFVAGVGFDDDVAAVVDVVMTIGAGETHGVDVGASALFPRDDVMDFAAFRTCGAAAACAVPVAGDDGFDLGFGSVSMGASHPEGLSFTVKDDSGDSSGTHQTFEHCLR